MSKKHDGKLDKHGHHRVFLNQQKELLVSLQVYEDCIHLPASVAYSLLAWLEQERKTLKRAANEDSYE